MVVTAYPVEHCHGENSAQYNLMDCYKLLPHPPYFPDIVPSDYFLFINTKKQFGERNLALTMKSMLRQTRNLKISTKEEMSNEVYERHNPANHEDK